MVARQPHRQRGDPSRPPAPDSATVALLARTAVVIPARNEEAALPAVLAALPMRGLRCVVVADNGSTDGTARVAGAAGAVVVHEARRGYGAACLAGLAHLNSLDPAPQAVVFLDADHPEDARRLSLILKPLTRGADLTLGVRIARGGRHGNLHLHARWGNRVVLAAVRLLFGRRFEDLPPFRAVRHSALRRLAMDDRNWGWTLQMQLRAVRHGLEIVEVEMPHRPRAAGRSKISGRLGMSLRVGAKMFYTLARERLRPAVSRRQARQPSRRGPPSRPPWPGGR